MSQEQYNQFSMKKKNIKKNIRKLKMKIIMIKKMKLIQDITIIIINIIILIIIKIIIIIINKKKYIITINLITNKMMKENKIIIKNKTILQINSNLQRYLNYKKFSLNQVQEYLLTLKKSTIKSWNNKNINKKIYKLKQIKNIK